MKVKFLILGFALLGLSGCVTSTISYSPPVGHDVEAKRTFNEPFNRVWDRTVKNLASDFFVINNVEKESRIINVSFSASQPSRFVDCGTTNRTFENAQGKQYYMYKSADSTQYTWSHDIHAWNAYRTTNLNGRANIYVSEDAPKKTTIMANVKYILDVKIQNNHFNGRQSFNQSQSYDFSTKQPYEELMQTPDQSFDFVCETNGKLEKKILNLAGG